jgi:DNA-binding MarR family transcriptional regulator
MKEIIELFEELHETLLIPIMIPKEYKRYFKDMTEGEYKYINIIYQNPNIKPSEFSKTAKISKPAATKIIQKFIRRNYIQKKKEDPEDRKSSPDSCVKCYTMFLPFLLIKIDVFS